MTTDMAHPCSIQYLDMKSSKVAGKEVGKLAPLGSLWEGKDKEPEPSLLMLSSVHLEWVEVVTKGVKSSLWGRAVLVRS